MKLIPAKTPRCNFKHNLFEQNEKCHGSSFCIPKVTPKIGPAKAKVRRSASSRIEQACIPTKYHSQSWLAETGWEMTYLFLPYPDMDFYIVYELIIAFTTLPICKVYLKLAMSYLGHQQAEVTLE